MLTEASAVLGGEYLTDKSSMLANLARNYDWGCAAPVSLVANARMPTALFDTQLRGQKCLEMY
jgi:hypothetical protein